MKKIYFSYKNVTSASYDAFGALVNRTYGNGIVTRYSYTSAMHRLSHIDSSVLNLSYGYDHIGNILSITDSLRAKNYSMNYDRLGRLVYTVINADQYTYVYNSIGNILKKQVNNESTKFVYAGSQAHAPSKVVTGTAGVDIHKPQVLDSGSRNRTVEFFLVNEQETTLFGVNWSLNFGDGQQAMANDIAISSNVMMFVQNNYSAGGDYVLNASAISPGTSDQELFNEKFGLHTSSLKVLAGEISDRTFELLLFDDVVESVRNASLSCSEGISSLFLMNFTGSLYDYLQYNYSTPGVKTFECNATSVDGTDSLSTTFTLKGPEVDGYDVLITNASTLVVAFEVENPYYTTEINVSITSEANDFSTLANVTTDSKLMVFSEVNYTTDGNHNYLINFTALNQTEEYIGSYLLQGVTIEDYSRINGGDSQILLFNLRNNWHVGQISWSLSEPAINNVSTVNQDDVIMVFVEHNYTVGQHQAAINATRASYIERLTDSFLFAPLYLSSFQTLNEGTTSTFEMVAENNLGSTTPLSWRLDSGIANISSSTPLNITNTTFIFVQTEYTTSNIHKTQSFINNSEYHDNRTSVVRI